MRPAILIPVAAAVGVFLASALTGAEYRGSVSARTLPLPGATVTAVQGDAKVVTTTDDDGVFVFADLPPGSWRISVEAPGFETNVRDIEVSAAANALVWNLTFRSAQAILAGIDSKGSGGAPTSTPSIPLEGVGAPPERGAAVARTKGKQGTPANPAFQRLDVFQSADGAALNAEGAIREQEAAGLSQSAADSFIVQGSVTSALGLPQQNDWPIGPGGPGGFGPGGFGPGGLGDPSMMLAAGLGPGGLNGGGLNGDGIPQAGPGGPGGRGGPPGGGPGGGGLGGPGGGGPGGPGGGGPGGFGGPGGRGGPGGPGGLGPGRGGPPPPGWQNNPNARAFGNARRNARPLYNGNVSFNFGNSALDARNYSVTGARVDKPAYASGRGGFTFGGPVQIPGLIRAEQQINFTLDVQLQRSRTGTNSQGVNMPTALERTGDFSQTLLRGSSVQIYDPTNGALFPGNVIPVNRINQASLSLLNYYPFPNLPLESRNYQTSWTGTNNSHTINTRLSNIRFGDKDRLNGGFSIQGSDGTNPNQFQFVDSSAGRGVNANLAWSRNITSRLVGTLTYTFSRNRQTSSPFFANTEDIAQLLGIQGTSQHPINWGPPNLNMTNYASLTDGNYSLTRNQTGSLTGNLAWVAGSHNMTFGGEYRRQQFNQLGDSNGRGTFSFNGTATAGQGDSGVTAGTGYDLADLLLGLPTTATIRYGNLDKYFRGQVYSLLVNDDWRIRPNLSLVLGARWDYSTPFTELYDRIVNLDGSTYFADVAAFQPGQTSPYSGVTSSALLRPDRNNISPRIGIAWRPSTNRSLVVRAGYGVYYNSSVYNTIAANLAQQPPFAQTLNVSSTSSTPLALQSAFLLATATSNTSTYGIDPNYRVGYAQSWNLSLQQDLPFGMFATLGYLGTKGTRLDQQFLPNSVAPGAIESSLPHGFTYQTSNGNSIYHAGQFQLNRRFRSGFMTNVSYQLSKSIDNAGTGGRGQGGTPVAQNWTDLSAERALSSFDSRHNMTVTFQYSTGMGRAGGTLLEGWRGVLFNDWTVNGNLNLRSGSPLTATVGSSGSQVAGTAVGSTLRANSTGQSIDAPGVLFNTAAFTTPATGEWGNAGRNTIPGPAQFNLNAGLARVIRLGERRSLDIQLQAQNVLNRVTINNWGTVLGSANFGLATSAAQMRRVTANVRVRF